MIIIFNELTYLLIVWLCCFSTLPSTETPYPMLVLVGPQGAGKKDLALKLVEEFPDYFGYGLVNIYDYYI